MVVGVFLGGGVVSVVFAGVAFTEVVARVWRRRRCGVVVGVVDTTVVVAAIVFVDIIVGISVDGVIVNSVDFTGFCVLASLIVGVVNVVFAGGVVLAGVLVIVFAGVELAGIVVGIIAANVVVVGVVADVAVLLGSSLASFSLPSWSYSWSSNGEYSIEPTSEWER